MATLTFLGAAQQVTGSCYLLESPAIGRVLLDCGMHQGGDAIDRLHDEAFAFEPSGIDALILSHAHLDHSGLIPLLVHQGFRGTIYCTHATRRLLPVMLNDAARLYERDVEYENLRRKRRGDKPLKALYSLKDVRRALSLIDSLPYRQQKEIGSAASLRFLDAGHILGSAITEVVFTERNETKTLVFSGDLGKRNSVLMNDPQLVEKADVVLMEGTYGNRNHRGQEDTYNQFEQILHETWHRKGNVLIPAFAVGRTQEILFWLGRLHAEGKLDNWQVILDSPMGIEVTRLYSDCANFLEPDDARKLQDGYNTSFRNLLPHLRYTVSTEESMAINRIRSGAIIIAGSGMCTGGRIRHHFKQRIWNKNNTVIFVGFQARGTLGRSLVDGAKKIHMFREEFAVKARIETLGGFSAHAGQSELIDWAHHIQGNPRLMLIHGEPGALDTLSMQLWEQHGLASEIPHEGQQISF